MKTLNRSNIIKLIIISIMAVAFACLATSCDSPSRRAARMMANPSIVSDTIVAAPIERIPLWKCHMVWADSTVLDTYTFAKDRYDADRTLTSDVPDASYISYSIDTVVVVKGVLEDRR